MKILLFILLFLIQHAALCEDQVKYVSSIAIEPNYHIRMVSDKVQFIYNLPASQPASQPASPPRII